MPELRAVGDSAQRTVWHLVDKAQSAEVRVAGEPDRAVIATRIVDFVAESGGSASLLQIGGSVKVPGGFKSAVGARLADFLASMPELRAVGDSAQRTVWHLVGKEPYRILIPDYLKPAAEAALVDQFGTDSLRRIEFSTDYTVGVTGVDLLFVELPNYRPRYIDGFQGEIVDVATGSNERLAAELLPEGGKRSFQEMLDQGELLYLGTMGVEISEAISRLSWDGLRLHLGGE